MYGDMMIGDLDLGLIPLDEDLLSMETPDIYREVRVCMPLPFSRGGRECKCMVLFVTRCASMALFLSEKPRWIKLI